MQKQFALREMCRIEPDRFNWHILRRRILLWSQRDVVEDEAEAGAGGVLASDGEFEGLWTGSRDGDRAEIDGGECAGRIGVFVADRANVCAVDAELEHTARHSGFFSDLDIVDAGRGNVERQTNAVAYFGRREHCADAIRESRVDKSCERRTRADERRTEPRPPGLSCFRLDEGQSAGVVGWDSSNTTGHNTTARARARLGDAQCRSSKSRGSGGVATV